MKVEELREKIGLILGVDPALVTDETGPKTNPAWDSMATLEIISMLEEVVPGEISEEETASFKSFGALVEFARRRGILNE